MGYATWLADALRAEGCKVVEVDGWKTRGHGAMSGVRGVMIHHTGVAGGMSASSIARGRPDLPGPIANLMTARDGTIYVVAAGRAYHAGMGQNHFLPKNDGNSWAIGNEVDYDGRNWTPAQWDAAVRSSAAIARHIKRTVADSVTSHKEYAARAQGKWDPGHWDMDKFRREVAAHLGGAPAAPPMQEPAPASPDWRLKPGFYYGPLEGPNESISGRYGETAWVMAPLRYFQIMAGITADAVYGPQTRDAALAVQRRHNLPPSGFVTRETFETLKKEKVTMATTLDTTFNSVVPGSSYNKPLYQFVLNADLHAYMASTKLDKVLAELTEVRKELAVLKAGR